MNNLIIKESELSKIPPIPTIPTQNRRGREWFVDEGFMDDIEREILYATLENKSIVVSGSAGSGK